MKIVAHGDLSRKPAVLIAALAILVWACPGPIRAEEAPTGLAGLSDLEEAEELLARARTTRNWRDRLNKYAELPRIHGNSDSPLVQQQVAQGIEEAAALLERDLNGSARLDELITILEGSANKNHIPRLLNAKAYITKNNAVKQQLYDRIIAEYGESRDAAAQFETLLAMVDKALLPGDEAARLALLDSVIARAETVSLKAFTRPIIAAILVRADLLADRAEIVRGYDLALGEGRRRAADFSGELRERLEQVLDAKALATDDPGLRNRYYDDIIALNPGPLPMAEVLLAKTRRVRLSGEEREAIFDRIIADYADQPDHRLRQIVNSAYFGKAILTSDQAERSGLFDLLISRNWRDSDAELRLDAGRALLAKASLANDRDGMLRAYEQIIDGYWADRRDWRRDDGSANERGVLLLGYDRATDRYWLTINSDWPWNALRYAMARRDRLAGAADACERYFDERIANARDDLEEVMALGEKAHELPDSNARIAVFTEIIAKFRNSEDLLVRREVAKARKGKADLVADPDEKLRLLRAIIADGIGGGGDDEYDVSDAYKRVIALLDDPMEKNRLYDELAARRRNYLEAHLLPYGDAARQEGGEVGQRRPANNHDQYVDWLITDAIGDLADPLFAKAGLTNVREEKISLYDRVVAECGGAGSYGYYFILKAVKAKAALLVDPSLMERFEGDWLQAHPDSSGAAIILARRVRGISSGTAQAEAIVQLLERFSGSRDPDAATRIAELLLDQADGLGEVSEKLAVYDRIIALGVSSHYMSSRRFLADALLKRLLLTASTEEKRLVYDWVIDGLKKIGSTEGIALAIDAILAKAGLAADPEETIRLCDEAIARIEDYADFPYMNVRAFLVRALRLKAAATGDAGLAARYYDRIIGETMDDDELRSVVYERLRLAVDRDDKTRVHDRAITAAKMLYFEDMVYKFLLAKAELLDKPQDKARLFDEALLYCCEMPSMRP